MGSRKYIVITGGVISGVGKGVATASIGKILQNYGYNVTAVKIDPYINCDAGTLRPTEHGEVWVTDDGGEIDQDLGNYERFLGIELPRYHNITTGQVYLTVIEKERRGEYLGETVQFIPHIPEEIINRIEKASEGHDITLIEIGGTVGDYENIPFLFAIKSLERKVGKENIVYVLITYLPVPSHIEEMKTKPTQQAIKMLNQQGIFPDLILCRARKRLDKIRKRKIEIYANIANEFVISAPDVDTLYEIPLNLEMDDTGSKILKKLELEPKQKPNWDKWRNLVNIIAHPKKEVKIAMIGKYVEIGDYSLKDSYISVNESLEHASANLEVRSHIEWISSRELEENEKAVNNLKEYDGIIVPGGFGSTGVEGKINAIKYARENNIPYLGLCFGMQLAIVEYARNVAGLKNANSVEINPETPYPVIDILESQKDILKEKKYGASMRLGGYAAIIKPGTLIYSLYEEIGRIEEDKKKIDSYKKDKSFRLGLIESNEIAIVERHRHRYEVNPAYIDKLETGGLVFSGFHRMINKELLMEFIELENHPFFVATQAHPEFRSRLDRPAPLFYGFIKAVLERSKI